MTQRPSAPDETVRMRADGPGGRPLLGGRPTPPAAPTAAADAAPVPAPDDPATERELDDTRPVGREWLEGARDEPESAVAADPAHDTIVVPDGAAPSDGDAAPAESPSATQVLPSSDDAVPAAPAAPVAPVAPVDAAGPGSPAGADPAGPGTPGGPGPSGGHPWWRRPALAVPVGLLLLLAVVYGVDLLVARGEVPRNTVVSGVDLGGLAPTAAADELEQELVPTVDAEHTVVAADVTLPFSPAEAGLSLDVDGTVDAASVQPLNPWTRLTSLFSDRQVDPVIATDDAALGAHLERVAGQVDQAPADATIAIDGTTPSVVEPTDGRVLDQDGAVDAITAALASGADPATPIELPVEVDPVSVQTGEAQRVLDEVVTPALAAPVQVTSGSTSAEVPVAAIAASLRFTPQADGELAVDVDPAELKGTLGDRLSAFGEPARDARFDVSGGSVEIVPSVDGTGVDPQKLADQLLPVLSEPAPRSVAAELGPVPADLTTDEAKALGIREEISSFTTNISNPNSGTNIRVVAEEVDGALVLPGETFSLNTFTGPRGTAQGYVPANVISGGQLSTAVGGGISQFATTMFNAVFFAGLEDVYHKPHSFYISRYPAGREATVFEGVIDLQWRNDSDSGVFVDTQWTPGSITVTFYGTKRFEIESISSPRTNYRQPKVLEKPDDGDCIPQSGVQGFDITVTRVFKDLQSGAEIERENFHTSYIAEDVVRCVAPKPAEDAAPSGAPASPSPGG
jgi:vancomycin resistance protein YoaR